MRILDKLHVLPADWGNRNLGLVWYGKNIFLLKSASNHGQRSIFFNALLYSSFNSALGIGLPPKPCCPSDQQPWPVRKCDERGWGGGLCVLAVLCLTLSWWWWLLAALQLIKWIGNPEQVTCAGHLQISQTHHLQAAVVLKGNKNTSWSWVFLQSSAALSIALLNKYLEVL